MNGMGLSAEALEMRRKYVQAGDAARIMAGEWRVVWREKMGTAKGDDLSGVLAVQMGLFTEPFNLAWCEKQTGRRVDYFSDSPLMCAAWDILHASGEKQMRIMRRPELQVSRSIPFMACNLDGMTTTAQGHRCVIDAKHVGRSDDPMILRYTAAGTHQATVMETDYWALSVFVGNSKWEYIEQPVDPLYQAELIAKEREFWSFVERNEEPEDRGEPILPPKPQPKLRIVQLDDEFRDTWANLNWAGEVLPEIRRFAETDGAAKINGMARSRIKALVPEDVGTLTRGLYTYKRTKAGAITMTMGKGDEPGQ